jgi:hypothetical protein
MHRYLPFQGSARVWTRVAVAAGGRRGRGTHCLTLSNLFLVRRGLFVISGTVLMRAIVVAQVGEQPTGDQDLALVL